MCYIPFHKANCAEHNLVSPFLDDSDRSVIICFCADRIWAFILLTLFVLVLDPSLAFVFHFPLPHLLWVPSLPLSFLHRLTPVALSTYRPLPGLRLHLDPWAAFDWTLMLGCPAGITCVSTWTVIYPTPPPSLLPGHAQWMAASSTKLPRETLGFIYDHALSHPRIRSVTKSCYCPTPTATTVRGTFLPQDIFPADLHSSCLPPCSLQSFLHVLQECTGLHLPKPLPAAVPLPLPFCVTMGGISMLLRKPSPHEGVHPPPHTSAQGPRFPDYSQPLLITRFPLCCSVWRPALVSPTSKNLLVFLILVQLPAHLPASLHRKDFLREFPVVTVSTPCPSQSNSFPSTP